MIASKKELPGVVKVMHIRWLQFAEVLEQTEDNDLSYLMFLIMAQIVKTDRRETSILEQLEIPNEVARVDQSAVKASWKRGSCQAHLPRRKSR